MATAHVGAVLATLASAVHKKPRKHMYTFKQSKHTRTQNKQVVKVRITIHDDMLYLTPTQATRLVVKDGRNGTKAHGANVTHQQLRRWGECCSTGTRSGQGAVDGRAPPGRRGKRYIICQNERKKETLVDIFKTCYEQGHVPWGQATRF